MCSCIAITTVIKIRFNTFTHTDIQIKPAYDTHYFLTNPIIQFKWMWIFEVCKFEWQIQIILCFSPCIRFFKWFFGRVNGENTKPLLTNDQANEDIPKEKSQTHRWSYSSSSTSKFDFSDFSPLMRRKMLHF